MAIRHNISSRSFSFEPQRKQVFLYSLLLILRGRHFEAWFPPCFLVEFDCVHLFLGEKGMDFHELLDIPQGDRRNYHDDVCVMIISLEGRIWRSLG